MPGSSDPRCAWPDQLCPSCRAEPNRRNQVAYVVGGRKVRCIVWTGEYDEEDHPILDGEPYMPGERICGHRDCVSALHLIEEVDHGSAHQAAA